MLSGDDDLMLPTLTLQHEKDPYAGRVCGRPGIVHDDIIMCIAHNNIDFSFAKSMI